MTHEFIGLSHQEIHAAILDRMKLMDAEHKKLVSDFEAYKITVASEIAGLQTQINDLKEK